MPVINRTQIADYKLLTSRHFFPGHYIITKSTSFNQGIETGMSPELMMISHAGATIASTGIENPNYSVLSLPIIVSNETRSDDRIWRDGLDFLETIIGNTGQNIGNTTNKIFYYNNDPYDASIIKKISIKSDGNSEVTIDIAFDSNVENVFEISDYYDDLLTVLINPKLPEMRTARSFDIQVGLQTQTKQNIFKVMTGCGIDVEYITDNFPIWGSLRPRPIFNWCNFKINGSISMLDDLNKYSEFISETDYQLYKPNFERYDDFSVENSDSIYEFAIDFGDIHAGSNINFTNNQLNTSVSRDTTNGVLISTINFFHFAKN